VRTVSRKNQKTGTVNGEGRVEAMRLGKSRANGTAPEKPGNAKKNEGCTEVDHGTRGARALNKPDRRRGRKKYPLD